MNDNKHKWKQNQNKLEAEYASKIKEKEENETKLRKLYKESLEKMKNMNVSKNHAKNESNYLKEVIEYNKTDDAIETQIEEFNAEKFKRILRHFKERDKSSDSSDKDDDLDT